MKLKKKGFMTAEAAVMFPLLIVTTITLLYLLIYVYDSILVRADLNSLVAALRSSERDFYYTYKEIKEEHVYISTDEVSIELIQNGDNKKISISCNWIFPLVSNVSKKISAAAEIKTINPFEIMLFTDDIVDTVTGVINDSDENNK